MDERRKQEDKELHCGHALVEEFGASVLVLLQQHGSPAAAMWGSRPAQRRARGGRGALVAQWLQEAHDSTPTANSTSTAAAARPAVAQSGLVVALLGGIQQHPVQRVQQLGLGHTQFVLVTWFERTGWVRRLVYCRLVR